jgi:hypothetical protein
MCLMELIEASGAVVGKERAAEARGERVRLCRGPGLVQAPSLYQCEYQALTADRALDGSSEGRGVRAMMARL